ncbi:TPA: hypothetical protein ACXPQL_004124 [Salmonella enterica]
MFISIEVAMFVLAGFALGYVVSTIRHNTNQARMLKRLDEWRQAADLSQRVIK